MSAPKESMKAREMILAAIGGSPYVDGKIRPGVRALSNWIAELEGGLVAEMAKVDALRDRLERATAFDGGPPIEVNGRPWSAAWRDADRYNCRVERRGHGSWAALDFSGFCLNKSGEWEYEPQPSSRDDDFKARARYATAEEALTSLDHWRKATKR